MRIKILFGKTDNLEDEVNDYISKLGDEEQIIDIKYGESESFEPSTIILIIGEKEHNSLYCIKDSLEGILQELQDIKGKLLMYL